MVIPVLVEPNYSKAIWVKQLFSGIGKEAQRRKYRLNILNAEEYEQIDYDLLFGDERRLVILAAVSVSYVPKVMRFLTGKKIDVLLVNYDEENADDALGIIRMNYEDATTALLQYLWDSGKKRIALYGVNPNSSSDHNKLLAYEKWLQHHPDQTDGMVFYNYASLADCYHVASGEIKRFDAFICTNNIVASSFIQHAQADGIVIPDDLYVAAMTDSLLLQRLSVPVTAVSPDYQRIGVQAVMLYSFLFHQKEKNPVSVSVPYCFSVRKSTGMNPWNPGTEKRREGIQDTILKFDFYSDREVQQFSKMERLLNICDETDTRLIRGLIAGETYETISEHTYLTTDSLKYRKKRMMKAIDCNNPDDFLWLLRFCDKMKIL